MGELLQHHTLTSTKYMSRWIEEKNKIIINILINGKKINLQNNLTLNWKIFF